jgi:hypothetical protein
MKTGVVAFQDFDMRQKLVQFGVQAAGNFVAAGVVAFLIAAWILTSPLIQLIDRIASYRKLKAKE